MEEKITIINRNGKKLSAIFHTPEQETKKIIIVSHSFKADKDYDRIGINFAKKICSEGYATLRFDCYGSGESEGLFENSDLVSQKEDLEDVIKFVESKGYDQIALAGLSQGAAISILAYTSKIKCLIFWSPALDTKGLYNRYKSDFEKQDFAISTRIRTKEKIKVGKKMWESLGRIKAFESIPSIKSPTLIICGSEDKFHLELAQKYIGDFGGEKKLEIIEDADHDFLDLDKEEQAISLSLEFVRKFF
jgi:uncharacterized protein